MHIQYTSFSPWDIQDAPKVAELVECYRDVFADGPWHEWLQCPVCEKYWGRAHAEELAQIRYQHCGQQVVDFWQRDKVLADLYHEITAEASCFLAIGGQQKNSADVIGFAWGYPISVSRLEEKLGLTQPFFLEKNMQVAYQDEVGVVGAYRQRGIAKHLVMLRTQNFLQQGLSWGIVRTRKLPEPSVTYTWYMQKLGYSEIAEYPDGDGRVILARKIDEDLSSLLS